MKPIPWKEARKTTMDKMLEQERKREELTTREAKQWEDPEMDQNKEKEMRHQKLKDGAIKRMIELSDRRQRIIDARKRKDSPVAQEEV